MSKTKKAKKYCVLAICDTCGKQLQAAPYMDFGELNVHWDDIVLSSTYCECKACGHRAPNTDITLWVYNKELMKRFKPEDVGIKGNGDNVDIMLDEFAKNMKAYADIIVDEKSKRKPSEVEVMEARYAEHLKEECEMSVTVVEDGDECSE